MEVLILDALLRPIDVVDVFESMIWTERYSEAGDFELVTLSTQANQKRFVLGTLLSITESRRIMRVEKIEETIDPSKGAILKIKGRDIVSILETRTALMAIGGGDIAPVWILSGFTPADTMRVMFNEICVEGSISTYDIIPFYFPGNLYPADTIPEPSATIIWEQKPASLYAAVKELGDIYDLGFRLYKDPNASKLYFNVYAGSDRTTAQTTLPPVIFSQDMENLQNTTEYSDVSKSFNVVHVVYIYKDVSDNEVALMVVVSDDDISPSSEGFERRVKLLVITAIPEEVTDIPAFLIRAGKDELMKSRPLGAFDGEISQTSDYVYERDYYLGDLVETRGKNGATSYMRVEEHIFVQDGQGQRSYPTLTTKKFINPGTWLSWKYDVEWNAMGSGEFWENQ